MVLVVLLIRLREGQYSNTWLKPTHDRQKDRLGRQRERTFATSLYISFYSFYSTNILKLSYSLRSLSPCLPVAHPSSIINLSQISLILLDYTHVVKMYSMYRIKRPRDEQVSYCSKLIKKKRKKERKYRNKTCIAK